MINMTSMEPSPNIIVVILSSFLGLRNEKTLVSDPQKSLHSVLQSPITPEVLTHVAVVKPWVSVKWFPYVYIFNITCSDTYTP